MSYKDPEKRREASRLAMEKKRKGLTLGVNKPEGLTSSEIVIQELTEHPVLKFLVDKDKRLKMESIVSHLKDKGLLQEVRFGLGNRSLTMDEVAGCLEVT